MKILTKTNIYYLFITILSIVIRIIYGYHSWYMRDHARVFDLGYKLFKFNLIPSNGSPVLLSHSVLPGSLQGILAAIPLYFSRGHPFSIIIFVQLLALLSCLIIVKMYFNLFEGCINKKFIFAFIILNPMSIVSTFAWNPSFIIIFSALYFYGLSKAFIERENKSAQFLIYFPHLLIFQLHLQFSILIVLTLFLIYKKVLPLPNFKIFLLSQIPGIITLSPTIYNFFKKTALINNSWNQNGNILNSIEYHPVNIFSYFHILARFLSFPTGDVSHNLGNDFIKNNPSIWVFFLFSMIGTAFIFCTSIVFYFSKIRWKNLYTKNSIESIFDKFDLVAIITPIITAILFVFSIAGMSSHKIWCLFPLSFYPFFRIISKWLFKTKTWSECEKSNTSGYKDELYFQDFDRGIKIKFPFYEHRFKLFFVFIFSSILYSTIGASYLKTNFKEIYLGSKVFCKNHSQDEINDILSNESHAKIETDYTFSLMCQYWKS